MTTTPLTPELPTVAERAAQAYVFTTHHVPMSGLAAVADSIPGLFEAAAAHGLAQAGPPLFRYRVIDMARLLTVEAGLPVAGTPPESGLPDGVSSGTLPPGTYATVVHVGSPESLVEAVAALLAWAEEQHLTFDVADGPDGEVWGSRLELYLTDPRDEPDRSRWETELAFRLADDPADTLGR